jgi:hypothetical protein
LSHPCTSIIPACPLGKFLGVEVDKFPPEGWLRLEKREKGRRKREERILMVGFIDLKLFGS